MPAKNVEQIRRLIAESQLAEAIEALLETWQGKEEQFYSLTLHVKERYNFLQNEMARGVISQPDAELERAKITDSLLFLTNRLTNAQVEIPRHLQVFLDTTPIRPKTTTRWILYGIAALLLLAIGYFAIKGFEKPKPASFDLKIQVQQIDNQPITEGKIQLRIGGNVFPARSINSDGNVFFSNIPYLLQEDSIQLIPLEMPFKIVNQSTTNFAQSDNGNINVTVEPVTQYTDWRGTVFKKNGDPFPQVRLDVESGLATGITDAQGNFAIRVPKAAGELVQVIIYQQNKQLYSHRYTLTQATPTQITME